MLHNYFQRRNFKVSCPSRRRGESGLDQDIIIFLEIRQRMVVAMFESG